MRWPNILAGSSPMKRFLIRLSALSVVAVLGFIGIAQAQRFGAKGPDLQQAGDADQTAAGAAGNPNASTPSGTSTDPFAATRPQSGPAGSTSGESGNLFDQARQAFPQNSTASAPSSQYSEPTPAVRGQDAPFPSSADSRYASSPRGSDNGAAGGGRYSDRYTPPATASEPSATNPPLTDNRLTDRYGGAANDTPNQPAQEPTQADRYSQSYNQPNHEPAPAAEPPAAQQPPARLPPDGGNPLRRMPASISGVESYSAPVGRLSSNNTPAAPEGTGRPGQAQLEGTQSPSVTIEKFAPAEVQIGKPAAFEILVRNVGQVRAQSVVVKDQIPRKTRLVGTTPEAQQTAEGDLVWNLGNLEPGDERTVKMEVAPLEEGELGSIALVSFSAASSAKTIATRPELQLEVTAAKEVLIGGDVALSIKISNPGTGPATGVSLRELVPEHFTHPGGGELEYEVGELKPGESRQLELVLKAAKSGRSANVLSARGDGNLQAKSVTELHVVAPGLEVAMTGPKRRFLEREANYTVSIANPGTAAAREIELVTYLPKGLEFVRADNYGEYDAKTRAVRWSLEELPANESGNVTLTVMPMEAGDHKVQIEGKAEKGLSSRQEQSVLVEGVAAILFQVMDVEDPIEVNGETTYEIRVVNQGSKAATDVQLEALLPPQMKPLSAEGPVRHEIMRPEANGTTVVFDKLARLAPKADTTYRVKAKGLQPGDMRMRVRVLTAEITTPVVKEESTRVYADE